MTPAPCCAQRRDDARTGVRPRARVSDAVGSSIITIRASAPTAFAISTTAAPACSASRPAGRDRSPRRARRAGRAHARAGARQSTRRHSRPLERERDIFGHREMREKRRLLVDRRDAVRRAVGGIDMRTRARRTSSDPASGRSAPVMILINVDLPAPFSPTRACTSPAAKGRTTRVQRADAGERFRDRNRASRSIRRICRRRRYNSGEAEARPALGSSMNDGQKRGLTSSSGRPSKVSHLMQTEYPSAAHQP